MDIKTTTIVLGSKSPRRQELIQHIADRVEVRVQDVDEIFDPEMNSHDVPAYLAELKAAALEPSIKAGEVILTADTVVILDGEIIGKPLSIENAKQMLRKLSGRSHEVISGCCLKTQEKQKTFSVRTRVNFKPLSEENINYYVDRFQPLDKAGAYGIQEWIGMIGVESIEGCYYNVMGLPIASLWEELQNF